MKEQYWDVSNEQVVEKTGRNIREWMDILQAFYSTDKKSTDLVVFLQNEFNIPRYWARTLTTHFLKTKTS